MKTTFGILYRYIKLLSNWYFHHILFVLLGRIRGPNKISREFLKLNLRDKMTFRVLNMHGPRGKRSEGQEVDE